MIQDEEDDETKKSLKKEPVRTTQAVVSKV